MQGIKKKLERYVHANMEITQLKNRIDDLKGNMCTIKSPIMDSIPASSGNNDKIGDIVAKMVDLENKYYDSINSIFTEQQEIEELIEKLEPVERLLIRARYIEGNTWESVCCIIGYGWTQTHRIHDKIIDKLQKMV